MELIGPIFEVIKCFGGPACTYIDHHRKLEEHRNDLLRRVDDLNTRKQDLEFRKEAELRCGKVVKKEVERWFEKVQGVNTKMEEIEKKFHDASFFLRGCLGKSISRMIEEVKDIHQQGSFSDGVAIDGPPPPGVMFPAPNLEGEIDVKEQIYGYLMGDKVGMIGVWGMGGIGKSTIMKHINNQLLKENRFDKVIWVTVSKELNIFKLQQDIANFLKQPLPDDESKRAAKLKDILEKERYVLILDDVWKQFSLLNVGIPEPTLSMERKVVLTSRSIEVCKSMDCAVVKVQRLSEEESMNLFLAHLGYSVIQDQTLKNIVDKIVEKCDGLPLSIVTIARSMKGENDIYVWRNALTELKKPMKGEEGLETEIFKCLKFSYDRLGDPKLQSCFLYCSLYPEDYEINKVNLIENWIDEGLLDGFETRQAMYDKGYSNLSKFENNCLLERGTAFGGEAVKMHDALREMALFIKSHQFVVKPSMQLKEPSEHEWTVSVEKVSLMDYPNLDIPPHISPEYRCLSTLILHECGLRMIPESFFKHMLGLKVLDLSGKELVNLPNSISDMKNLSALILSNCDELQSVPSLTKLKKLRKLHISNTGIEEVPHGLEMLENLRYLCLRSNKLKELPDGIFSTISHIQCLMIEGLHLMGEEVGKLRKLEYVSCSFCDVQEFKKYAVSAQGKWPAYFNFNVGSFVGYRPCKWPTFFNFYVGSSVGSIKPIVLDPNFKNILKLVTFKHFEMERCADIVIPNSLHNLIIQKCDDLKCLSNIPSFSEATDLKICQIEECEGIEYVVDLSLSSCNAVHKIEELTLLDLCNLREVVRIGVAVEIESISHAPTPPAIFSSLKRLHLYSCSKIKKLFPVELSQGIQNLEEIRVHYCEELEEIIPSEEEKEENHEGEGTTFILPKLKSLELRSLPKLKSICSGGLMIPADSLQYLHIVGCPEVKKIPLFLPLVENGKPSPPHSLKGIIVGPAKWWESVEWDHKDVLSAFVTLDYYSGYYSDENPNACNIM